MDRDLRIRVILDAVQKVTGPLLKVARGSKGAAADLKKTRGELKALNQQLRDVSGYRETEQALVETSIRLKEARLQSDALGRQFRAAEQPSARLTRQFNAAREAVARLERQQDAERRSLAELTDRMRAAGLGVSGLDAHERDLRASLDRTNQALKIQQDRLEGIARREARIAGNRRLAGKLRGVAGDAAVAGGSMLGAGGLALNRMGDAVEAAQDFESVQTDIAQKGDMARDAAVAMGKAFREMGVRVNAFPEELQAGMDVLTGRGLDARLAQQIVEPLARARTAYKASVEDLAGATFSAVDNLKIPVEQTSRILDIMAFGSKRGAVEVADMASGLPGLTAAYQRLGQEGPKALADLVAAQEIAMKGAASADEANNNVANLLQKINAPDTRKKFAKAGIDINAALAQGLKDGRSPIETIVEATRKATRGDAALIGDFFEDAQVQRALAPLIANFEAYRQLRADALSATGVVERDFAERMKDAAEQVKNARIEARNLKLEVGGGLSPAVVELAGQLKPGVRSFTAFAKAHPGLIRLAGILALVVAAAGALAIAFAAVVGVVALIAGNLAIAAWVAGIGAAVLAVGGFVAILWKDLAKLWDDIRSLFDPGGWMNLGKAAIDGLVLGFKLAFPPLAAVIDMIGRILPKPAAAPAGSSTPLGKAGMPKDLAAQVFNLGAPPPLAPPKGAQGAATGGALTINVNAPAIDQAAMKRAVEAELRRQQAAGAAARRSAYRDD